MTTLYVRNELLTYVFEKYNSDHEFDIDRVLYKFYNEDAVKDAKKNLWQHYAVKLPKWEDRYNTAKSTKEKEIKDILSAVKTIDEVYSGEELPVTFAAVKFCNIPSDKYAAERDVNDRLKVLELQVSELVQSQANLCSARVARPPSNQKDAPRRPIQIRRETRQHSAVVTGHSARTVDDVSVDGDVSYSDVARGSAERPAPDLDTPRDADATSTNVLKVTRDGWQTQPRSRRRRTKVVRGKKNDEVIKQGQQRQDLFVFRVMKSVEDSDIEQYIKNQDGVDLVSCERVSHEDAPSKSYHVVLHTMEKSTAMDPEFWPTGVSVRMYFRKRTQDFTVR